MTSIFLAGKRVMVAEDELLVSMLIEDVLADAGCLLVGPFTTVPDALAAARGALIDVALLDVNLRGQKIYPAAEALAARGIPFLLLSGYGRDAVPANHPDWASCSKPFKTADLTRMLVERVQQVRPLAVTGRPDARAAPHTGQAACGDSAAC